MIELRKDSRRVKTDNEQAIKTFLQMGWEIIGEQNKVEEPIEPELPLEDEQTDQNEE